MNASINRKSQLAQAHASKHIKVAGCVEGTSDDVDDAMLPSENEAIQQHAEEWVEVLTHDNRMSLSLLLHNLVRGS